MSGNSITMRLIGLQFTERSSMRPKHARSLAASRKESTRSLHAVLAGMFCEFAIRFPPPHPLRTSLGLFRIMFKSKNSKAKILLLNVYYASDPNYVITRHHLRRPDRVVLACQRSSFFPVIDARFRIIVAHQILSPGKA